MFENPKEVTLCSRARHTLTSLRLSSPKASKWTLVRSFHSQNILWTLLFSPLGSEVPLCFLLRLRMTTCPSRGPHPQDTLYGQILSVPSLFSGQERQSCSRSPTRREREKRPGRGAWARRGQLGAGGGRGTSGRHGGLRRVSQLLAQPLICVICTTSRHTQAPGPEREVA